MRSVQLSKEEVQVPWREVQVVLRLVQVTDDNILPSLEKVHNSTTKRPRIGVGAQGSRRRRPAQRGRRPRPPRGVHTRQRERHLSRPHTDPNRRGVQRKERGVRHKGGCTRREPRGVQRRGRDVRAEKARRLLDAIPANEAAPVGALVLFPGRGAIAGELYKAVRDISLGRKLDESVPEDRLF